MSANPERILRTRLLELDPELASGLEQKELARARTLTVPALRIERGPWTPTATELREGATGEPLFLLVLRGLLFRVTTIGERRSSAIAGRGDVLPIPRGAEGDLTRTNGSFIVAEPAIVALLDEHFLAAARRWPALMAQVLRRLSDQLRRAAVELAVSHLPRTEDRVLALAWHLAGRFGHAGRGEVTLPVRLTHDTIGTLIGAERSTVTLAIRRLEREGALRRDDDGLIRLLHDSAARFDDIEVEMLRDDRISRFHGVEAEVLRYDLSARLDGVEAQVLRDDRISRFDGRDAQRHAHGERLLVTSSSRARTGVLAAMEHGSVSVVEDGPQQAAPVASQIDADAIRARLLLAHELATSAIRRSRRLCNRSELVRSRSDEVFVAAQKLANGR